MLVWNLEPQWFSEVAVWSECFGLFLRNESAKCNVAVPPDGMCNIGSEFPSCPMRVIPLAPSFSCLPWALKTGAPICAKACPWQQQLVLGQAVILYFHYHRAIWWKLILDGSSHFNVMQLNIYKYTAVSQEEKWLKQSNQILMLLLERDAEPLAFACRVMPSSSKIGKLASSKREMWINHEMVTLKQLQFL